MNTTTNNITSDLPEWVYYEQIVFSGVIALIGIPGNILIILVFIYSQEKTTTDNIVFALATNDLFGSLICTTFSIMQQIFKISFQIGPVLLFRVGQYLTMVTSTNSDWLLSLIAFDRYTKTCRPHSVAFTDSRARWACVIICAFVPTIIGPAFFTDVKPSTCLIDSECESSVVYFIIAAGSCLSYLIVAVAYTLVAVALGKRLKKKLKRRRAAWRSHATGNILRSAVPVGDKNDECINKACGRNVPGLSDSSVPTDVNQIFLIDKAQTPLSSNVNEKSKSDLKVHKNKGMDEILRKEHNKVNRTTIIMFLITAINILTFILLFIGQRLAADSNPRNIGMAIGYIARTSYMVNYIANPLFYMGMSSKFRESARNLFKKR